MRMSYNPEYFVSCLEHCYSKFGPKIIVVDSVSWTETYDIEIFDRYPLQSKPPMKLCLKYYTIKINYTPFPVKT